MHFFYFPPASPVENLFSPSLDWHTLCIMPEVIEKHRKQIFSIRFRSLSRLTERENVLIANEAR